jgi:hypothetical protein
MIIELLVTILKVEFYRLMSGLAADPPIFERKLVMYSTAHCDINKSGYKMQTEKHPPTRGLLI